MILSKLLALKLAWKLFTAGTSVNPGFVFKSRYSFLCTVLVYLLHNSGWISKNSNKWMLKKVLFEWMTDFNKCPKRMKWMQYNNKHTSICLTPYNIWCVFCFIALPKSYPKHLVFCSFSKEIDASIHQCGIWIIVKKMT